MKKLILLLSCLATLLTRAAVDVGSPCTNDASCKTVDGITLVCVNKQCATCDFDALASLVTGSLDAPDAINKALETLTICMGYLDNNDVSFMGNPPCIATPLAKSSVVQLINLNTRLSIHEAQQMTMSYCCTKDACARTCQSYPDNCYNKQPHAISAIVDISDQKSVIQNLANRLITLFDAAVTGSAPQYTAFSTGGSSSGGGDRGTGTGTGTTPTNGGAKTPTNGGGTSSGGGDTTSGNNGNNESGTPTTIGG